MQYTTTNANINSAAYRAEQRTPARLTCDCCGEPAKYRRHEQHGHAVVSMNLCAACDGRAQAWKEAHK